MKLVLERVKGAGILHVQSVDMDITVREFVLRQLQKLGKKPGTIETSHPDLLEHATSHYFLTGKSKSVMVAFSWLDALGYDVYIVKREHHDL